MSIARLVEKKVMKRPFLQEALSRGIINYGALAEHLLPSIEKDLDKKVKLSAVMMALRRLSEKLEKKQFEKIKFHEDSSIIARDSLIEVTVEKSKNTLLKIRKLFDLVDYSRGDFLTVTQGVFEITIITNKKYSPWISKSFRNDIIKTIKNLSALTLTIPLEFIETPGFFYLATRALAWENINLQEVVSTAGELTFIVKSNDVTRAFEAIKELVKDNN